MSNLKYFYRENPELEKKVDAFFRTLSQYNDTHFNGELSIILLGSLSRGEATWLEGEKGPVMVSDIEFFTVYPEGFTESAAFTAFMNKTAGEIFADQDSTLFHIDNTYVCRNGLASLERKLLTYDAKKMGKMAMGADDICRLPEITLQNINLWDIRDILTHRVFSVLYYGFPLKQQGKEEQYRYSLAKNSLDLMTVLLVTQGRLESGFINRLEAVKQLQIDPQFQEYFAYCLSIKLMEQCEYSYTTEQMEACFLQLLKLLAKTMKVPFANTLLNGKHVARRVLGGCKRALKYKHFPNPGHLRNLIQRFEEKQVLTSLDLLNNLVLNGYPIHGKEEKK